MRALQTQPERFDDLDWVWDAFQRLTHDRPIGFGAVGSIPFLAIDRYADRFEIEDFDEFYSLIRAMDEEYLAHAAKKAEKPKEAK